MITKNTKCKLAFKIFSLLCFIAIFVCFICDFAINKSLTWSRYPLISTLCAWVVISPLLLAEKHKVVSSLAFFTVIIIPFLNFLERLTPVKGWFFELGRPVALTAFAAIWVTYVLIKFVKINKWYRSAAFVFIYAVVVSSVVNYYVDIFLGRNYLNLSNIINIISSVVVTALIVIIGYYRNIANKTKPKTENNN